jgi:hypothetical protein
MAGRKIAFIGSHGVRKTTAAYAFLREASRRGLSPILVPEVIRDCPLPINEGLTPEAALWAFTTQITRELELGLKSALVVCDRSVVDHAAYYLRATNGQDPLHALPLLTQWALTYDLFVRLLPDVTLVADGFRSTNDAFRDAVEAVLDRILPEIVPPGRLLTLRASEVDETFDFVPLLERLMREH